MSLIKIMTILMWKKKKNKYKVVQNKGQNG